MVTVELSDLVEGLFWADASRFEEGWARISRETGTLYVYSELADDAVELPEDIEDNTRYAEIPTRWDLDLQKRLVLRFADEIVPDHGHEIEGIFRRRGAYSRFKDYLHEIGQLDAWYKYEEAAVREALCRWARREGFEIAGFDTGGAS